MKVAAQVWRHVPPGAEPLHLGRLFRFSAGRWNVRGEYACLYTALTRDGALGELHKARAKHGSIVGPRDVVSIDIEIEPVLDLRDAGNLKALSSAAGVAYAQTVWSRITRLRMRTAIASPRKLDDKAIQAFSCLPPRSAESRT